MLLLCALTPHSSFPSPLCAAVQPVEVRVRRGGGSSSMGGSTQAATWLGGSIMAASPMFSEALRTREQYQEWGPSACRESVVFTYA